MRVFIQSVLFFFLIVGIYACSSFPYAKTNRQYKRQAKALSKKLLMSPEAQSAGQLTLANHWVGTTNFDLRKPNFVVIHHTAQNACEQTLKTFTLERTKVSAHYVICKDGTVHHMLNDYMRAWHGGIGSWGNNTELNSSSIGIEIDNRSSSTPSSAVFFFFFFGFGFGCLLRLSSSSSLAVFFFFRRFALQPLLLKKSTMRRE